MLTPVSSGNRNIIWVNLTALNYELDQDKELESINVTSIDILEITIKYVLEQDLDNAN